MPLRIACGLLVLLILAAARLAASAGPVAATTVEIWPPLQLAPSPPEEAVPRTAASLPVAQETPPQEVVFSAEHPQRFSFPTKCRIDAAGLHLPNNGRVLLLKDPLPFPASANGLTTTVTLGRFEKTPQMPPAASPFRTHVRMFWTPSVPANGIEPYLMTNLLLLIVEYRDDDATSLMLYRKTESGNGYGKLLWSGMVENDQYPIRLSVWFDSASYRVKVDQDAETIAGSLSGKHELPVRAWDKMVRFGMNSTFGTAPGEAVIQAVALRAGR